MSRLTELIDIDGMKIKVAKERPLSNQGLGAILHKLYVLEELEQDLGCSLEVREKAFDNGFYDVDGNYYICEHYVPYLKSMHTRGIMRGREKHFNLEDYKKTWWLSKTKEE